jgi:LPS-assembly lipoprotein
VRFFFPVIITTLLIGACGFRPLYSGTNTLAGDATTLDNITISDVLPGGSSGLALKNALIDRFYHHGYPSNAQYVLKITVLETGRNIIIQKDSTTTRSQLVLSATYDLEDRQNRKTVDHGVIRAVGAYNVLQSQYTTLVTQNAAREAAINEMADKITMRMAMVIDTGTGAIPELPSAKKKNINAFLNEQDQ